MKYTCMICSVQCPMCSMKCTGSGRGTGAGTGTGAGAGAGAVCSVKFVVCSVQGAVKI